MRISKGAIYKQAFEQNPVRCPFCITDPPIGLYLKKNETSAIFFKNKIICREQMPIWNSWGVYKFGLQLHV